MRRLRGEEQPGFFEILHNWLPHQPWFTAARGRRQLTRVGGLRLPTPEGDPDAGVLLELHLFDVEYPGQASNEHSSDRPSERFCVPLALRSRPSALAGKSAFIGKLTASDGDELWVYDGARDRAFLTAWLEMARRRQGSRNGRSRGEAFSGFDQWEAFELQMRRQATASPVPHGTRTVVAPEDSAEDGDWEKKVAVDILRQPEEALGSTQETILALTHARSMSIPRVLGMISASWEERRLEPGELVDWQTGPVGMIREAGAEAPDAWALAKQALQAGKSYKRSAQRLGQTLGNFHADLAGAFGAHPQSTEQRRAMAHNAQQALETQWARVRDEFDDDEAADLTEVIDHLTLQLREADQPLMLQTIHGSLDLHYLHRFTSNRWVVAEASEMVPHALGLRDVVMVLMSFANLVMEVASETPEIDVAVDDDEAPENAEADEATQAQAEQQAAASTRPVNFGRWYEELTEEFIEGYRSSDADSSGLDSVFFRAAMLAEALELFSQWEGKWVFRPSMLLHN